MSQRHSFRLGAASVYRRRVLNPWDTQRGWRFDRAGRGARRNRWAWAAGSWRGGRKHDVELRGWRRRRLIFLFAPRDKRKREHTRNKSQHLVYASRGLLGSGEFVRPAALRRGDTVSVIAPAGPFDRTLFFRGLGFLREHFRVRVPPEIFDKRGYLAGTDATRLASLNRALRCQESQAIVCARGGFGCTRIAAQAEFSALQTAPKWLVGFSDVTALHCEVQRQGVMSVHGPNVTGLGRGDAVTRDAWLRAVADPSPNNYDLTPLRPGRAQGPLVGGNLTLLVHCLALGRLSIPDSAILVLEEIAEAPYRVDRLLTSLWQGGVFDRLSGVVLGQFTHCGPDEHAASVLSRVAEIAQQAGVVAASGWAVGHEPRSLPWIVGGAASLSVARSTAQLRLA